ncbi:MAG: 4a-hydroxytetrahydrobiopterin dehydratase [Vicinamibacterales bacterium]
MLTLLRTLIAHKGDATDALLRQVLANAAATDDPEIRALLNHILVANRFWAALICGVPFDIKREVQADRAPAALPATFSAVLQQEGAWLEAASEAEVASQVAHPLIPGTSCSVAEAFMQVCLHTHGHRAQVMKMLRGHGITPEPHDFIVWLSRRHGQGDPPNERPSGRPSHVPRRALTADEIQQWLATHADWALVTSPLPGEHTTARTELTRVYTFPTFDAALAFMRVAASFINETNHHPRWENSFRTVTVWLSTWDIGHAVSQLDANLGEHLDAVAARVMAEA